MYLKTFIRITTFLIISINLDQASYLNIEDESRGKFFGDGYTFSLKNSKWSQSLPPRIHPALKAIYKSPTGKSSLTIRETDLTKKTNLKKHVESWIKDYRKYGLNLLKAKPIKINDEKGFLIDSKHILTKKVFRQMVFLKDKKSVTLTCKTDEKSNELISCAELIKNFSWIRKDTSSVK